MVNVDDVGRQHFHAEGARAAGDRFADCADPMMPRVIR
jgi:hypothetical protein